MQDYRNDTSRNSYDINASEQVQENFETAARELLRCLDQRDQDVKNTMAAYQADGVSERYESMEHQWNEAGREVRNVINTLRASLAENDRIADGAMRKAAGFIPN
ncbi:hypothetical protein HGQ17_08210 [Nesterenkonia sp. MY13]|uniref:WXG100 family type VII secretion target n=1 Tax=Nesterenkonia sedimenti TaxID=1463632 RepID=A0A7X8TJJ7_9MICC|nr:hypothetical protein [Nesterenkonia sedimenti]NLS09980.1 hypothetical protein [Nesterenkonia sedimenti]